MRIALLEDDTLLAKVIRNWLVSTGHDCQIYGEGQTLIRTLGRETFDLIILDWMLPDISGIEVLRWIRRHINWRIPVLFVTARDSEADIVQALNEGADDYMTKPVKQMETLARINALGRRALPQGEPQGMLEFGKYEFDVNSYTAYLNGDPIELTRKEFELAVFLFRSDGRILSRGHILESVWGQHPGLNTRTVDTHVSRLRQKLELRPENGWQLKAIYQHGYRLEKSETAAA